MSPWYLPVVVNGQMPVTSPIAQSPSPARRCASTGIPWPSAAMPTVSSPMPSTADGDRSRRAGGHPAARGRRRSRGRSRRRHARACGRVHAEHQLDAVAAQDVAERLAQRCGLVGEHALGQVDECHLAAEAAHGLGHLDADRTAAQDQEAAGDRGHRGHLAVRPHALELPEARNRRHDRFRAGGHDDVPGGVPHAVDFDRAGPGEPAVAAQQVDAVVGRATSRHWCPCGSRP